MAGDRDFDDDDGEGAINPEDAALIVSPGGEITLLIPHYEDDDEVPSMVAALGVLAVKLRDPAFVDSLVAEIDDVDEDDVRGRTN